MFIGEIVKTDPPVLLLFRECGATSGRFVHNSERMARGCRHNTLHFAIKVVCHGSSSFGNPRQQTAVCCPLWEHTAVCCLQTVELSACSFL